jgi:hypothetical protein
MMVRRRYVDMTALNQSAILSKGCRVLPAAAQQLWQYALMRANMPDDKDCRRTWNWQRSDDAPEGIKATG